jgi:hypothetical protein
MDTRQSETLREGGIMMYPKAADMDAQGRDANDRRFLTFYALHTRLSGAISGPDVLGATASAYMEGEFFGMADTDVNGFRLRHAYAKLDWGSTQLLFGQYWHPMFDTPSFGVQTHPQFNFASPFIAYSRNPQIRLTHEMSSLQFMAAALMQTDFKSFGPDPSTGKPVRNAVFIRNAGIPELDVQIAGNLGKGTVAGVSGSMKSILPRLKNEQGATDNMITSFTGQFFCKIEFAPISLRMHALYGQNLADLMLLGGYAVKAADTTEYTNIKAAALWAELSYGTQNKDPLVVGLFFGYDKNLGTDDAALTNPNKIYAMGANVDNVMRVAPHVQITISKIRFVAEIEHTIAKYGTYKDDRLRMDNLKSYSNTRFDLAVFYLF